MSGLDQTTTQVYSVLFVMATVVLLYTARFFQARRGRRKQRELAGLDQIPQWTLASTESSQPLHLAFGGADLGGEATPAALAQAELFYHIIERANASDTAPLVTLSSPATIPLAQDTLRRAWRDGDTLSRAQWIPPDLAYAGAISLAASEDEPTAHILAGRFGAELALILDSADGAGQPSLALSDRLDGQAVAFAMADHVLIGEELFAAPGHAAADESGHIDATVLDVWRALIIIGVSLLLLLNFAGQLAPLNFPLILAVAAVLFLLGFIIYRRR